jgi:hypothetical protein
MCDRSSKEEENMTYQSKDEALAAWAQAKADFRNTDYDDVDELEEQEEALIAVADSVIAYLASL